MPHPPPRKLRLSGLLWGVRVEPRALAAAAGLVAIALTGENAAGAKDAETADPVTIKKTESGLHFQVPTDWPIEKRGGVMAPIPIEEYLSRKFNDVATQVRALEQRFNGLEARQRTLEDTVTQERQARRAAENAQSKAASEKESR